MTLSRAAHGGAAHGGDAGFALLELIAALTATFIIGALFVSASRTYAVRSEIAGAIAAARSWQDGVAHAFRQAGEPPPDGATLGLTANTLGSADSDAIKIADGRIDIRFGAAADPAISGGVLSLTPFETTDLEVVWICGNRLPGPGLKPLGFAAGGRRPKRLLTTVAPRYLPHTCR